MYNKLFTKILDSSIWMEPTPTRIVWLTLIAAMDEHGFCQFASPANVAHRARVSPQEALDAIACLEAPDANSSDTENEGRRLERVSGGWVVLNAEKYRLLATRATIQAQTRERVKSFRERVKRSSNAVLTPSEAYTEVHTDTEQKQNDDVRASASVAPSGVTESVTYQAVARGPGLIMTSAEYARKRETHRHIGARLHIPNVLHRELMTKLGGDDPDAVLVAWYAALDAEVEATRETIPDLFKWIRPKFVDWATANATDPEWEKIMKWAAEGDAADAIAKAARRG